MWSGTPEKASMLLGRSRSGRPGDSYRYPVITLGLPKHPHPSAVRLDTTGDLTLGALILNSLQWVASCGVHSAADDSARRCKPLARLAKAAARVVEEDGRTNCVVRATDIVN